MHWQRTARSAVTLLHRPRPHESSTHFLSHSNPTLHTKLYLIQLKEGVMNSAEAKKQKKQQKKHAAK
jgi:hypothetical protein